MKTSSTVAVLLAILAPLIGFLGVMVGHWGSRAREVRALRARVYAEWLQAAEQLPLFEPPQTGTVDLPTMPMIVRMLNVGAELAVVAPMTVLEASNTFVATATSDDYRSAFGGMSVRDPSAALRRHQSLTRSVRAEAISRMRKDLLPWWQRKARGLPEEQAPAVDAV
jgi:hypothetical protein